MIQEFKRQFVDFGLVSKIKSDNAPQHAFRESKDFTNQLKIERLTYSPGFPRANGQTDRTAHTVRQLMAKAAEDNNCSNCLEATSLSWLQPI